MDPIKIVCLIGPPPYLNYFINEVSSNFDVKLIVREHTPSNRLLEKIKKKGIMNSLQIAWQKISTKSRYKKEYDEILKEKWKKTPSEVPLFNTHNINDEEVRQKLIEIQPDLILVHGTSLIKEETLKGFPLVLNLHWGLSPYYKGSFCTDWALINHDPYNIGFTIHQINTTIDGGDILTQGRISINQGDTCNLINMKLTREGTKEIVNVVKRIINKEQLQFQPQNNLQGTLYLTKHWNSQCQKLVRYLEKKGEISRMLNKPSKKELPIIKWISNN